MYISKSNVQLLTNRGRPSLRLRKFFKQICHYPDRLLTAPLSISRHAVAEIKLEVATRSFVDAEPCPSSNKLDRVLLVKRVHTCMYYPRPSLSA